jgi:hemolysin activation/secretion protein
MPRLRDYTLRSGFRAFGFSLLLLQSAQAVEPSSCIRLEQVDVDPSAIFDESDQTLLLGPLLGRCIDSELIAGILSAISSHFIANGYVTSRPYLLEQDISDGQIEIRILAGKIEAIVDAETGASNGKISTAFIFNDEILNLRELETSLEVIERAESVSASFEIRPGEHQGGSVIAIETVESNRFRSELGFLAQTDLDGRLSLQMELDNPLDINDIIEFRYNSGEVLRSLQSSRSRELTYSFPLGNYLFSLNHSDIRYDQRIQGINGSFLSEGDTVSNLLQISKIISRSQTGKLTLAFSLELKDTQNFFDGQQLDVSSYKTSKVSLGLRHLWLQSWGQLTTSYSFHQGLDSYGARDDDYFTVKDGFDTEARLQFKKLNIDSQALYYLDNPAWYASFKLHLQYSDDVLFDNDRLYMGSPYTVRGYTSALSGSNAWYLRSDLTRQFQGVVNPLSAVALVKTISLSAGIDYGEVKCEFDNQDVCGEIYGLGLGLELSDDNFNGRIFWGHPLKEIGDDIGAQDIYLLDLRWSL